MESSTNDSTTPLRERWQWQWQSNPNPWDKKEEEQWESYSPQDNYLIEKAYFDQKKEIQIGCYTISIKHKIQSDKGDAVKQRPIRRANLINDIQEIDRSQRYFETELPKTINSLFGSLGDFATFFSRRNQSIWEFTNHFNELEKSNDLEILNNKIAPKLVECLEEALLKPIEEEGKNTSLSFFKKKMLTKVKELISPFRNPFSNFEEFYVQILKAYTMNTSLYSDLNEYLRNESWIEIDKLLPYAFCLCKAFFNPKLKANLTQDKTTGQSKMPSSIFLYRGTAFDESALRSYDTKRIQQFSWYSVTSTTTSEDVAKRFMFEAADIPQGKYPVLFVIEIPLVNELEEEYLKLIDVHQYSAIPEEAEAVLAPGSVFEVAEVSTDKDNITTIKIKLRNEIKSLAHRGMMMQGALQNQMATEKEAKIVCLEGEGLSQALRSLCGNKLIEKVEICLCKFSKKSLSEMFEVLSTLEKAKELKFIALTYEDNGEIVIKGNQKGERCLATKIEVVEANDFFQIILNERQNHEYWRSLRELDLDFRSLRNTTGEELGDAVSQWFKYLPELTHLSLNFGWCRQITNKGVECLTKELISLIQLRSLNLNFELCEQITDEGANILAQRLGFLTQLTHLNLDFNGCREITDEGTNSFAKSFNSLTQITHLNLIFGKLTHEGMNCLSKSLNSLTQLTHFNFVPKWCTEERGISPLIKLLSSLPQLTHLNLNLRWCREIAENMNCLVKGLESLTELTYLNLSFKLCEQITDDGVLSLAKGLNSLTQLAYLHLSFKECKQITSETVSILMSQGLKSLTTLTSLILDFDFCDQITGHDLHILSEKWLKHLISLKSPIIQNQRIQSIDTPPKRSFRDSRVKLAREKSHEEKETFCEEVLPWQRTPTGSEQSDELLTQFLSDKFVSILGENEDMMDDPTSLLEISEIISEIHHLTSLTFYFERYQDLTDGFLQNLSSRVLMNLSHLRSLTMNFRSCIEITDQGVIDLASYGLKPLINLASLSLDFAYCDSITNKGVAVLVLEGLNNLSQLKSLALNFCGCYEVNHEELLSLASHGFRHLSQLEALALSAYLITDKGIDCFVSQELQHLTHLKFLGLDFSISNITDKGVNNMILGIAKSLPQLTSLDLKYEGFENVSDITIQNIIKVLHYFGFTKEIDGETLLDWKEE